MGNLNKKSLLIFDDQVLYFDGFNYSSDEAHILFMIGLSNHFSELSFVARILPERRTGMYVIPDDIDIIELPHYDSVPQLLTRKLKLIPVIIRILHKKIDKWSFIWVSWPTPIALLIILIAKIFNKKSIISLVVRQNLNELVRLRYKGISKFIGLFIIEFIDFWGRLWKQNLTVFTVGQEMFKKYSKIYPSVFLTKLPPLSKKHIIKSLETTEKQEEFINLLYVGRLEPEKGIDILLQAVGNLKKKMMINLFIGGSGADEIKLRKMVDDLGINDAVFFLGYVKFGQELFNLYSKADYFILPSLSEGFPNVIMEAMAFGVAIVSSDVGGISEIIKHKENGWLAKPGSPDEIVYAIESLVNDEVLSTKIRSNAKKEALLFTFEEQQKLMLSHLGIHECTEL